MKGNVIDLAVAVIIGGAFGKIVTSVVTDIITPVIGMIGGNPDFSKLVIGGTTVMKEGKEIIQGGIMLGNFINALIAFLMMALVIFFVFVKPMKRLQAMTEKPKEPEAPKEPSEDIKLLTEIRDLLKNK